jgi:NAD(P)-dependent dehydrogenase (short-subunit alcohol dehydrogenase family)
VEDLLKTTLEHWDKAQAVNLPAPFQLTQKLIPGMINQRRGTIINNYRLQLCLPLRAMLLV